jgi:hypothetical protein
MRHISATLVVLVFAAGASAATLFPRPLHLVRTIGDPVSGSETTVDQYCSGNRIITLQGSRIAIADFGAQRLTEIDRAAAVYSITPFAALAAAQSPAPVTPGGAARWREIVSNRAAAAPGVAAETRTFRLDDERQPQTIEVGIDRRLTLGREAFEALSGAAYPNAPSEESEVLARAARVGGASGALATSTASASPALFALPVEQRITRVVDGTPVVFRSGIVRIEFEEPPPELLVIPPGARIVESPAVRLRRELDAIDRLPSVPRH